MNRTPPPFAVAVSLLAMFCTSLSADDSLVDEFLQQHCFDCHRGKESEGGLDLEELGTDLSNLDRLRRWVLIYDRVGRGEMPPKSEP